MEEEGYFLPLEPSFKIHRTTSYRTLLPVRRHYTGPGTPVYLFLISFFFSFNFLVELFLYLILHIFLII